MTKSIKHKHSTLEQSACCGAMKTLILSGGINLNTYVLKIILDNSHLDTDTWLKIAKAVMEYCPFCGSKLWKE